MTKTSSSKNAARRDAALSGKPQLFRVALIAGLFGLALATGLIVWSGYEQVFAALAVAGWGIVWTSLAHLLPKSLAVLGWQILIKGAKRPSKLFFLYVLWIRAAVNNLMPVARIGGEVVSVRLLMQAGLRRSVAIASTVVETTISVIAVFIISVLGVGLFLMRVSDTDEVYKLVWGLLAFSPLIIALVAVQRFGAFTLMMRIFGLLFHDLWAKFAQSTAHLDRVIRQMYRRTSRIWGSLFWQTLSWGAGAFEIWLALSFLGHPLPLVECFMIEALIQATATAAFLIPGALGVQEAGFMFFGHMLGLTPDIAAALAMMRRCRDLMLYVPALIVWQVQEGRGFLSKRKLSEEKA